MQAEAVGGQGPRWSGLEITSVCFLACIRCTQLQSNIWARCRPDLIMCWELAFAAIPQQQ